MYICFLSACMAQNFFFIAAIYVTICWILQKTSLDGRKALIGWCSGGALFWQPKVIYGLKSKVTCSPWQWDDVDENGSG